MLFQSRRHIHGRYYEGFIRGDQVLDFNSVKTGDKLILVSDKFAVENLLEVETTDNNRLSGTWLEHHSDPRKTPVEIKNPEFRNLHRAVKVPTKDLSEVDQYDAQELLDIMITLNGESRKLSEINDNLPFYRDHVQGILSDAAAKINKTPARQTQSLF